jgi:hypothetical protein
VPLRVYDETIRVLKSAVQKAKLGRDEELGALKRLDDQTRRQRRNRGNAPAVPRSRHTPFLASPCDTVHSAGIASVGAIIILTLYHAFLRRRML